MSSISDYKSRVARYGGIKSAVEKHSKHNTTFFFKDSPSYEEVTINDSEELIGVQIVSDTKVSTVKKILMQPNDKITSGDVIHRTEFDESSWLCTSVNPNAIYDTGFIEKCNSELKWIDDEGVIHSYPAVFYYGTRANFGTYDDKVMTLPDGRRQVVVQRNEHTKKLKRDMRFMFGGNVFKVIDFDHVSDEGVSNLNLKDDLFNPATDNLELGIADYVKSDIKYEINIIGGDELEVQIGNTVQLQVIAKKDGTVVENPNLIFVSQDESIVTVDDNGLIEAVAEGSADVVVYYRNVHAIVSVDVVAGAVEDKYSIVIKSDSSVPNEVRDGQEKSYYVEIYRNSELIEDAVDVEWELYSDDKTSNTNLAKIVNKNGLNCTVRNNDVANGYVQLKVSSSLGDGIETWIRIRMRPLF